MKNKSNKGFTLLELLVSLTIITFILFAFFRIINTTTRVNTKNDRDIKALNIAQTEVENLRNQIKTKLSESNERKLYIYNDLKRELDKKEEIEFINNVSEKTYLRILKNENGSENRYNIKLNIKRELIQGNKKYTDLNLIHSAFNDYKYIIDKIEVKLEDKFFSKKITRLNNIQILASNSSSIEEVSGEGENYLTYCLKIAYESFNNIENKELYNLIMIEQIKGNKTLLEISKEQNIDILTIKNQLYKINNKINEVISTIRDNNELDNLNKGKYYIKISEYILSYYNEEMKDSINDLINEGWNKAHNKFFNDYDTKMQQLYTSCWPDMPEAYSYYFNLYSKQKSNYQNKLANITTDILNLSDNIESRKHINTKINNIIDEIIYSQVYEIEKYFRENIQNKLQVNSTIIDYKEKVLSVFDELSKDLMYVKAITYHSNYYKNK